MTQEYTIGALWIEGSLSYLEQLCLKSFLDNGHRVVLYHYGELENVPDGIELADANEILPAKNFLVHEETDSLALHSDLFRYRMLAKTDKMIWADTDAYCRKPFIPIDGHLYGYQSEKSINGGVLCFPKDSATFEKILAFTSDEYAVPTWYRQRYVRRLQRSLAEGNPIHASKQPWGVWGPSIITHFLNETGEAKFALPMEYLYPFSFGERRLMQRRRLPDVDQFITENTMSIHFFGRRMRALLSSRYDGTPLPTSVIGRLLRKHEIDPHKAPIPGALEKYADRQQKKAEQNAVVSDKSGEGSTVA
ncbi:MAG: hypothetical protein ACSHXW_03025 [Yoonia sp.]